LIVFLAADFPPSRGGIQQYVSRLAVAAGRVSDAIVLAPEAPGSAEFDAVYPLTVQRIPWPPSAPGRIAALRSALEKTLPPGAGHTVIASSWNPAGIAAALVPRARLIVIAHGSEIVRQRSPLRRLALRLVARRARSVVANSDFTRELLAQAGIRARVTVIRPAVSGAPRAPEPAPYPLILSVARLVPRKGIDTVLAALAQLRERYPDLRYEVIGSGPDASRLRSLAAGLGLAAVYIERGEVDDRELDEAYARAWCFALPVRREGDDVEGFGIVYLEAALRGLPAIGGTGSGADEAIVDRTTGFLVDGRDVAAVASALDELLGSSSLRARLGRQAQRRAAEMTWEAAADRFLALT
jgi:phosphatidylinositol alpha-1,6-mannosyltransferase